MFKRFCHAPHPSEPASFAGTVRDLAGGLAIVAALTATCMWLAVLP